MLKKNIKIIVTTLTLVLALSAAALATQYVGSSLSDKFHEPSCRAAKKILPADKIVFSSRQDAINKGYKPCKICRP